MEPKRRGRPPKSDEQRAREAAATAALANATSIGQSDDDASLPDAKPISGDLKMRGVSNAVAAALIGISDAYVGQLVKKGKIAITREGLIPYDEVRRLIVDRTLRDVRGVNIRGGDSGEGSSGVGEDHDARLKKAKADMAEVELQQMIGNLVSRSAVDAKYKDIAMIVKRRVLPLADSLPPILFGMPILDMRQRMTEKLNAALAYLSRDLKIGKRKPDESDEGED